MAVSQRRQPGACRILDEREWMLLVGADREVFLASVMDPPAPSEKLVATLKRHRPA